MSSFKPGDWIQCTYANGTKFVVQVVSETSVKEAGRVYPTTLDSDWVAWQPKVGEWCWFWDENYTTAILAKFENISNGLFVEHHGNIFEYCEPFIGQLPTHLKDQS